MLTIFRRHLKSCGKTSRTYKRCRCPIHVEGTLGGERIRESLDLVSWEAATSRIREWETAGKLYGSAFNATPIKTATDKLLTDLVSRHVSPATTNKYQTLINQLHQFCQHKGIGYVHNITLDDLRDFRASWKDSA